MKNTNKYIILFSLLIILSSCKFTGIKGNGDLVNEVRRVDEFDKVDVSGIFEVKIDVSDERKLEVIAESNFLKYIKTKVKNNILFIYSTKNLKPNDDLMIIVNTPRLNGIECSGATEVSVSNIASDDFDIDVSGAAFISISGKAENFNVDVSGAADLDAKNFVVQRIKIDVSGAANADVYSDNFCRANVSGAADISLYGKAVNVNYDVSGAGSFQRK